MQLNTAALPEPMREQAGAGVIQVFYCTTEEPFCAVDLEGWYAFSDAHVVRRVQPQGQPALSAPPSTVQNPFPPRRIVGWQAHEEVPSWEERDLKGVEIDDEVWGDLYERGFHMSCDKLGGWPAWVQGPERPACPECGAEMQVLFQINSEDHLPIMFGDLGTGHVSVCSQHPDMLAFGWACG